GAVRFLYSRGRLAESALGPGRLDIPEGVRETIRRRVEPLSDTARRVLAAAAVIGREFDIDLLARVVGLPPEGIRRELEAATRLGVIQERAERPGGFRFAHALGPELGAEVRAELHRDAGATLEVLHGNALDHVLGDIARHYFEAAPLGTLSKAIEFATRAGQHAYGQLGYEEAAGHFERALQASRGMALSGETRFAILFPLGMAQQAAGDQQRARATLIEAAQVARDRGYMHGLQQALTAAAGEETGTVDWTLVRLLEEAIGLLGPRDARDRIILLAQLSRSLYFADAARRHAYSEEALALARGR